MIYGYLYSKENMQQLKEFGISEKNIYTAREELFKVAKSGDIIVFKSIDELGEDFEEIKSNFDFLVIHGIILQFLEQPLLNTAGKTEDTLKTISFLLEYFIERKKRKINRIRGRKSAYKNLTEKQKEILEDFHMRKISLQEAMKLTKLSKATVYKLRKLLFPPKEIDLKKEIYNWTDGKITLKQCMENTGFCRSYLFALKKKLKSEERDVLLPEDKIFYPVKYLNEETDFSKLPKFGKIVKFTINPREEHIDYSYGYDRYSEMTEVYKIEKFNKKSIWFGGEKFTNQDFKYKNNIFIYYNHLTAKKDLDNEIKNKLIFYLSQTEVKYKKQHLKLFKSVPSLKQPFREYINSLSQEEKADLILRIKSKIFINKTLKDEEKNILEKELKEFFNFSK